VEFHEFHAFEIINAFGGMSDSGGNEHFVRNAEGFEKLGIFEVVFVIEALGADPEEDGRSPNIGAKGMFGGEVPGIVAYGEKTDVFAFPTVVVLNTFFRFVARTSWSGRAPEFRMLEKDASGPPPSLRKSFDGTAFTTTNGAVGFVDVRNEFFDENIFTESVFLFGEIVPTHGTTSGKDVDGWAKFFVADGFVDITCEIDALEFAAWTTSVKVVNDWETCFVVGTVGRRQVNVIPDIQFHGRALKSAMLETFGDLRHFGIAGWRYPTERARRLLGFLGSWCSGKNQREASNKEHKVGYFHD
jgi:hypothetical protein